MAQIQEVITDTLGNTITLIYDEEINKVTVNNTQFGSDFVEITTKMYEDESGEFEVTLLDGMDGKEWEETWSDKNTRWKVSDFYYNNKVK